MDYRRTSPALSESDKLGVVSLADAKAQMRVVDTAEDAFVSGLVADAYDWFAGERGWLNHCCLLSETFQADFKSGTKTRPHTSPRGGRALELPMRPVLGAEAVTAVQVLQFDGSYVALDPTSFTISIDADTMIASIVPTTVPWPKFFVATQAAYRVAFTAGFGAAADVPGPICRAIKLLAATMYNQRESTAEMVASEVMYGLRALAGRYRLEPDHS